MSQPAPLPSADLPERKLPIEELPAGTPIFRFHWLKFEPNYFDKSQFGRFNSPDGRYGVLYAALEPQGAFAETLLRDLGKLDISEECEIKPRAWATYRLNRRLNVVRLYGFGLSRIGATASVSSCEPYSIPQSWSAALHGHPDQPDGILYRSNRDNDLLCLALFERAADALELSADIPLAEEPQLFDWMEIYGVGLV